jgi:poly(hydroxyalkanoate) depolymerase family esterase
MQAAAGGRIINGTYANDAGERAYRLYIPASYSGQPLPLIVMLHGCHQTAEDFAAATRMNALAELHTCLMLYPAQSTAHNQAGCWHWFRREDQIRGRGEPAIIAGMTREVLDRYTADSKKTYVAGLSAGGAMAAVMAVTYPELYAATGIHSGLPFGSAHDLRSALAAMSGTPSSPPAPFANGISPATAPAIVFHGDEDQRVHPRNGVAFLYAGRSRTGPAADQITVERGRVDGGHAYTRTLHRDTSGRVVLEHWMVHGAGHTWFGGAPRASHTDPRGPDASAAMMRFFLQHT